MLIIVSTSMNKIEIYSQLLVDFKNSTVGAFIIHAQLMEVFESGNEYEKEQMNILLNEFNY